MPISPSAPASWSDQNHYPRLLADVNGDGMDDIVGFGANAVVVSLATGNGTFGSPVFGIANYTTDAGPGAARTCIRGNWRTSTATAWPIS